VGDVSDTRTVLVRVTGPDEPGISTGLFGVLADIGAIILDVEQVVVRRRLTLDVLIGVPHDNDDALKSLLLFGFQRSLEIGIEDVDDEPTDYQRPHVVTVIGPDLTPTELKAATDAIAAGGGNIDRIVRLSRYPVMSYEFAISAGDPEIIRRNLLETAHDHPGMDLAIQPQGLSRRAKRLVVLDVDSTLIQDEAIDLLAEQAGCRDQVAAITDRAMAGEIDFTESVRSRVALLEGLDEVAVERAWHNLKLTPGARTFCRTLGRLGYTTAIVSGGFTVFTERLSRELGIDYCRANELEIVDGHLTGRLIEPVIDRASKAAFLREVAEAEGVPMQQTVAVGDGANDLDMLAQAGLGIAFNAKPVVRDVADTSLRVPYLDAILFLLGVSREEIEAADAGHDD
jgi:phosphoserine phosphatase